VTIINSHNRVSAADNLKEAGTKQVGKRSETYSQRKHVPEEGLIQGLNLDIDEILIAGLLKNKSLSRDRLLFELLKLEQNTQLKTAISDRQLIAERLLLTSNAKDSMPQKNEAQLKAFAFSIPEHIKESIMAAWENLSRKRKVLDEKVPDKEEKANTGVEKYFVYVNESKRTEKNKSEGSSGWRLENILLIFVVFLALGLLVLGLIR